MFATNKYDYVQIEAQFFGDFFVSIQETNVFGIGQTDSKAIVQNVYPDYRGLFLPSLNYRPMEQWHINMIKSPLFMPLKTRYTTRLDNLQDNVYANIDPFVGAYTVSSSAYSIIPGSSNDSTGGYYDNFGEYTLGATVAGTSAPTSPNAFFLPGFNVQYSAELLLDIEVTTTSAVHSVLLFRMPMQTLAYQHPTHTHRNSIPAQTLVIVLTTSGLHGKVLRLQPERYILLSLFNGMGLFR